MMHRRVWSAGACVLLALLVIAEVEESVGSWETESFAGDELNDWSWLNVAPYTPPESFEHYPNARVVIVTGSSENHAKTCICALRALRSMHPDPAEFPIIHYNLGLTAETEATMIDTAAPGVEFRRFPFEAYPPHFQIVENTRGEYAWKPIIVMKVLLQTARPVLWLDAGDRLWMNLKPWVNYFKEHGVFTSSTSGNIEDWVHPAMFSFFQRQPQDSVYNQGRAPPPDSLKSKRMLNGAIVMLTRPHRNFQDIAVPWAACALAKECIAPEGSHRGNHRQDQAALSVLAHWKYPDVLAYKHDKNPNLHKKPVKQHQDSAVTCPPGFDLPLDEYVPVDPRTLSTPVRVVSQSVAVELALQGKAAHELKPIRSVGHGNLRAPSKRPWCTGELANKGSCAEP